MKKLLSILLSVIMAISVMIIPTSVSAKKAKTVPNTYVATYDDILNFSKGTITGDHLLITRIVEINILLLISMIPHMDMKVFLDIMLEEIRYITV
jgi:nitrogen fixation protein FixH